jgi:hypothetical protein
MLHGVSTRKIVIVHRQADFLKGLSSCCHEGRLVKAIRFPSSQCGLTGIFDRVSIAVLSSSTLKLGGDAYNS